jgi:hypothetical protein
LSRLCATQPERSDSVNHRCSVLQVRRIMRGQSLMALA